MSTAKRIVLVTGGNKGIGLELSRNLSATAESALAASQSAHKHPKAAEEAAYYAGESAASLGFGVRGIDTHWECAQMVRRRLRKPNPFVHRSPKLSADHESSTRILCCFPCYVLIMNFYGNYIEAINKSTSSHPESDPDIPDSHGNRILSGMNEAGVWTGIRFQTVVIKHL
jgi:hypothetical protein